MCHVYGDQCHTGKTETECFQQNSCYRQSNALIMSCSNQQPVSEKVNVHLNTHDLRYTLLWICVWSLHENGGVYIMCDWWRLRRRLQLSEPNFTANKKRYKTSHYCRFHIWQNVLVVPECKDAEQTSLTWFKRLIIQNSIYIYKILSCINAQNMFQCTFAKKQQQLQTWWVLHQKWIIITDTFDPM